MFHRVAVASLAGLCAVCSTTANAQPTVTRDAGGTITVRAIRTTSEMRVDGRLDEDVYGATAPITDFVQQEPERVRSRRRRRPKRGCSSTTT